MLGYFKDYVKKRIAELQGHFLQRAPFLTKVRFLGRAILVIGNS
jgi:hypothetical protein